MVTSTQDGLVLGSPSILVSILGPPSSCKGRIPTAAILLSPGCTTGTPALISTSPREPLNT
uniref:Uncharacterized protein n=1 Tax=Romanomermis culicivorax TaxID=13658 RepID=A0A915IUJ7_ROMCU